MKPKILIDDNIPYIAGRLEPVADVEYVDQFGFTPDNLRDADAMIIRTRTLCNRDLLENTPVRLIATATIGMDQIDIPWCENKGIRIANSPGCNAPAVAQYVWAGLLRSGFDPKKQTLGIVGCGNVGSIVKRWGELLGAKILVNDPPKEEAGIPGDYTPLDQLLAESDAVTLHTPLIRDGKHPSYHLISAKEVRLLKPGAILVNAARGPVIDTETVVNALRDKKIRAIIDTWEGEPVINKELMELADYATFHIAGYSRQGKERATRMVLEEVEKEFGIEVDKSGLAQKYTYPEAITAAEIVNSYDPATDTDALRSSPDDFDTLRRNYAYREEVQIING
ncbi:MAG: 4-phosphoerythronate dehydrogenase [Muribaculaceae bacterium]|nr:4-phosphoerythronate dehydrogenase [Muribaculaceae bacterium]